MWVNIEKQCIPVMRDLIWEYPELASKEFNSDSLYIDLNKVEKYLTDDIVMRFTRSSENSIRITFTDEYNKKVFIADGKLERSPTGDL